MAATSIERIAPGLFVLLWSSGFIGARLGLPYIEPLGFLSIRCAGAVALLAMLAFLSGAPLPRPREVPHIAVAGVLIHAGCLGGVFVAIKHGLPTGIAALVMGLQPILTALAANPLLGERTPRRQWIGLALGLIGVAMAVGHKVAGGVTIVSTLLPISVALISITAGTLYQKRFCAHFDLRTGSAIQFAASLLVTAPLALAFERLPAIWTPQLLFALAWLVVVVSIGAISLLNVMIRQGSAVSVASVFYLTPPTTAILAWWLFGEKLPALAVSGLLLAAAGVALARRV